MATRPHAIGMPSCPARRRDPRLEADAVSRPAGLSWARSSCGPASLRSFWLYPDFASAAWSWVISQPGKQSVCL
ncbi:hypothetical protein VTN02DRAFT_1394 [Thermoascus thermophilus]